VCLVFVTIVTCSGVGWRKSGPPFTGPEQVGKGGSGGEGDRLSQTNTVEPKSARLRVQGSQVLARPRSHEKDGDMQRAQDQLIAIGQRHFLIGCQERAVEVGAVRAAQVGDDQAIVFARQAAVPP